MQSVNGKEGESHSITGSFGKVTPQYPDQNCESQSNLQMPRKEKKNTVWGVTLKLENQSDLPNGPYMDQRGAQYEAHVPSEGGVDVLWKLVEEHGHKTISGDQPGHRHNVTIRTTCRLMKIEHKGREITTAETLSSFANDGDVVNCTFEVTSQQVVQAGCSLL